MFTQGPSQRYGAPQNPQPIYPYPPEENSHRRPFQPPLPSMSTLFSRTEPIGPGQMRSLYPPPQPFQAQYHGPIHPLQLSEMNPTAPVQYIHHGPQEGAHAYQYQCQYQYPPEPTHLQAQYPDRLPVRPQRVPIPPLPQSRQAKKIGQRRHESERDFVEINRSSALQKERPPPPPPPAESKYPNLQNDVPYMKKEVDSNPPRPSKQRSIPPQQSPSVATPVTSSLLSESSCLQKSNSEYFLHVRQQPMAARACGFGERDRRVIDPPPILQLQIKDPSATPEEISTRLRIPYLVVHVTLWDPSSDTDASAMPGTTDKRQQRRLMGTLVSSPFVGKDEYDVEGCFFTFPDLSVRTPGRYLLRFNLAVINPMFMQLGSKAPIRAMVKSAPFDVFNAKDFGGMRASTALTKRLKHQGCLISVKKGNGKSNKDDDDDDGLGDDENDMTKPPAKRNKKR